MSQFFDTVHQLNDNETKHTNNLSLLSFMGVSDEANIYAIRLHSSLS